MRNRDILLCLYVKWRTLTISPLDHLKSIRHTHIHTYTTQMISHEHFVVSTFNNNYNEQKLSVCLLYWVLYAFHQNDKKTIAAEGECEYTQ